MLTRCIKWDAEGSARLRKLGEGRRRWLFIVLAHTADTTILFPAAGLIWLFGGEPGKSWAWKVGLALLIGTFLTGILKLISKRRRPDGRWGAFDRLVDPHSFPSGHANRVAILAIARDHPRRSGFAARRLDLGPGRRIVPDRPRDAFPFGRPGRSARRRRRRVIFLNPRSLQGDPPTDSKRFDPLFFFSEKGPGIRLHIPEVRDLPGEFGMGGGERRSEKVLPAGMAHPGPDFQFLGQGRRRDFTLDRAARDRRVPRRIRAPLRDRCRHARRERWRWCPSCP